MVFFLARNLTLLVLLVSAPLAFGEFWAYQLGLYFLFAIATLGVGLSWGQTGILSLGQGMFVALGAYVSARWLLALGSSPAGYLVIPIGVSACALLAYLIAVLVFRGRTESGTSFSLITLALTLAAFQIATSWTSVTGGFNGLRDIPGLPGLDGFLDQYYAAAIALAVCVASLDFLVQSPAGVLWRAVSDNERRLAFLGYDTARLKACAFAVSAALGGLAGALYAQQQNLVTPDLSSFGFSGDLVVYAAVGGRATVLGPAVGAIVVGVLSSELRDRFPWWEVVLALFFIVVVLRLPGGLMTAFEPLRRGWLGGRWTACRFVVRSKPRTRAPLTVAFDDVRVRMGDVTILDGLSLNAGEDGVLCVIGPNGAGKTSTLNTLTGLLPRQSGRIVVDGDLIAHPNAARLARLGLGRKFQTPSVFAKLTIDENLAIALWSGRCAWHHFLRPSLRGWSSEVADEMRARFRFLKDGERPAAELSHGERQVLELSMALATEPRLLLLDEPCAGLSHEETVAVVEAIKWARQALGLRVIIIEHDMELVRKLADRVVVLHQGRFLADGSISEVQQSEKVRAVYLGGSR